MKKRMVSLLLALTMVLGLMPATVLSAAAEGLAGLLPETEPGDAAGKLAQPSLSEEDQKRLLAGEFTSAELDALIEEGLVLTSLGEDPYEIAPSSLDPNDADHMYVNPDNFKFLVNEPRVNPAPTYENYDKLKEKFQYLPDWKGPLAGAQASEDLVYDSEQYPELNATGVEYELTRLSYHDTAVYRIGYIKIETKDKDAHYHLYASSEVESGTTSHFVLPDNAKITVEYSPKEPDVTYELYVDGVSRATSSSMFHDVYGNAHPKTTTNQHVSTTVTIPEGYYGRVFIGDIANKEDPAYFPTTLNNYTNKSSAYEKYPLDEAASADGKPRKYGQYALGEEPSYKAAGNEVVVDTTSGPGFFSLTGTYQSGKVGTASTDLLVRVVLQKRASFKISNAEWLSTTTGTDATPQSEKIEKSNNNKSNSINGTINFTITNGTITPTVTDLTLNDDGSYNFKWTFTTTVGTGNVRTDWELRTLTVNGDYVQMPLVDNPPKKGPPNIDSVDNQKLGYGYAIVSSSVTADNNGDKITRTYEITFSNVTRDLVITTSAFQKCTTNELVISTLEGVELTVDNTPVVQGQSVAYNSTGYTIRFKLADGYAWPKGSNPKDHISFVSRDGTNLTVSDVSDPDNEGWYSTKITGSTSSTDTDTDTDNAGVADFLSIKGTELKRYQIHYLDGTSQTLQAGFSGMPTAENIEGMPDFSAWNGDKDPTLDNNGEKYYDAVNYEAIIVDAHVPTDKDEDRPAVFRYWVLTNAAGEPINKDTGNVISDYIQTVDGVKTVDVEKLAVYKGDYTADLQGGVPYAFPNTDLDESNLYDIYLTALWEPAAQPFVYYITLNKIDENGTKVADIAQTKEEDGSNKYPIGGTGRGAFVDRRSYAKVNSTTVIFEPDSDPAKEFLADPDYKWYKFDEQGQYKNRSTAPSDSSFKDHNHVYQVSNYGEVDVWLYYTLGGLTVKNETPSGSGSFTYRIEFTLPAADDTGTPGDETKFFDNDTIRNSMSAVLESFDGSNGVYTGTFRLQNGGEIKFPDMPAGTTYTITQTGADGKYVQTGIEYGAKNRGNSPEKAYTADNAINALYDNTATIVSEEVKLSQPRTVTYDGTDLKDAIKAALTATVESNPTRATITGIEYSGDIINAGSYYVTVKGTYNDFPFTVENVPVTVSKATPTVGMFTFTAPTSLTYNGQSQAAAVENAVKLYSRYTNDGGNITLTYEYVMCYKNPSNNGQPVVDNAPTDAGVYKVKVNVDGNGENLEAATALEDTSWTFTIAQADLAYATVTLSSTGAEHTGQKQQPTVESVTMQFDPVETLIPETDYTVDFNEDEYNYTDRGNHVITIKAVPNSNYTGYREVTFSISDADIADATVRIDDVVYDGQPWWSHEMIGSNRIGEHVHVTVGSQELIYATHFTIDLARNVATDADTYYIVINAKGEGGYYGTVTGSSTGQNSTCTFTIKPASISDASVSVNSSFQPKYADYTNAELVSAVQSNVVAILANFGPENNKANYTLEPGDFTVTKIENSGTDVTTTGAINAGDYTVTIKGTGNFTDTKTVPLHVDKADPTADMFDVSITGGATYNGNPQSAGTLPTLKNTYTDNGGSYSFVYYKGGVKVNGNPTDAGTYTVKVAVDGKGDNLNSTGDSPLDGGWTFTIARKNLTAPAITLNTEGSYTYDGTAKQPGVTIKESASDPTELKSTDFKVDYENNTNAGTASVIVTAADDGNYTFTRRPVSFSIARLELKLTWKNDTGLVYDGTAKNVIAEPGNLVRGDSGKVTVMVDKGNEVNAGSHTAEAINLSGDSSGNYTLPTDCTHPYTIEKADPTADMFIFDYDRDAKEVNVRLDYTRYTNPSGSITVEYYDGEGNKLDDFPTAAGTYKVKVIVDGNGTNLKATEEGKPLENDKWTFTINEGDFIDLSGATVTLTPSSATYNGSVQKPAVKVTLDGSDLTEGTDYTIEWGSGDYIQAGAYTITIKGQGNYTGTKTASYTISKGALINLSGATVTLTPSSATYNGSVQKPAVKVTLGGSVLTEGTDYTIGWGSGDYIQAGAYTITITGKGDYTGTKTASYTISPAAPSGGGGVNPGTAYPPNISEDNHGKTTTSPSAPRRGVKTTIRPEPNPGYTTGNVVVKDRNGNELDVTDNGDGSYSFTQPNGSVTIDVEYVCTQSDEYCYVANFDDTDPKAWYHDGVHYCVENGLMDGVGSNLFSPNVPTSRAMIAIILWRIEGSPVVADAMSFSDVADGQWYTEAIRWAASEGMVLGVGNNLFKPDDSVTREQLVTMLYRYAEYKGLDMSAGEDTDISSYDDASDSNTWARTALQWAVGSGLVTGRTNTTIAPLGNSTRAEAATMFQRYCTEICD